MPKYTSVTGRNVVLKFHDTIITIPTDDYYETTGEDLADLFPDHIRKVAADEVLEEVEPVIPVLHIREIPSPALTRVIAPTIKSPDPYPMPSPASVPVLIPSESVLPPVLTPVITPVIHQAGPLKFQSFKINPPSEVPLAPIKEVVLLNETNEKIVKTINTYMDADEDLDVEEFLSMVREFISDK